MNFELRLDVLNVFDNINFTPGNANHTPWRRRTIFTTTTAYQDFNNQFDPGGRPGQIVFRLNW